MIFFLSLFFLFFSFNIQAMEPENQLDSILEFPNEMQREIKEYILGRNKPEYQRQYIIPISDDALYCEPGYKHMLRIFKNQLFFIETAGSENLPDCYSSTNGFTFLKSFNQGSSKLKLGKKVRLDLSDMPDVYHFVINNRLYSAEFEPRGDLPPHGDPRRFVLEQRLGVLDLSVYSVNCKEWIRHFPAPVEKANFPAKASLKFILYLLTHEKSFLLQPLQQ